jgi:site-specific DNA-methyltransferase (adenine-specific)
VVTSPVYNCGTNYGTYNDNVPHQEWEELLYDVFEECDRVMAMGARIAVNVPWGIGRQPYSPVYSFVLEILNNFFELLGTIVWKKAGTPGSTAFGSFRSPASPSLRDHTESILIAKKSGRLNIPESAMVRENGKLVSPWLSSERFLELTRDYWEMATTNSKQSKHPAAFPVELPKRVIELYGYPGCTVLDPFAGSGNTGKAAKLLGCDAYLVDIDVAYCELMKAKLLDQSEMF